uniref:phenylalanine-tRNA ligase beta subunit n=1 Tax=Gloiopeltis furcata TaxID=42017 RepID=UPI0028D311C1|nr:phenylalanine-tRNA ligase beta subunit [Gloiopeltis furcata]WMP13973.1 phenylalanine-tRNA ligase beta subunit [Gloiopeltis furcata]
MKFSWKWLKTLVNLENVTLSGLITQLTLAGIEVENVEEKPDIQDITLTIHVTTNRSDVSCLIGVAREVATLFNLRLYKSVRQAHTKNDIMLADLAIKSNSLLDINVSKIQELEPHLSPNWLKYRLKGCGIASSNLYTDVTNYINIKWGQDIDIFDPYYKNNFFCVTVPEYRKRDIRRAIDVVEEIGRIYGFEKFIHKIPQYKKRGSFSKINIVMKSIRLKLRSMGLHEIVSYSLQNRSNNRAVNLYNPLIEEQSKLRNSLIYNLLDAREYNLKQAALCLECFEIGRVFHKTANTITEQINVAGLIGSPSFSRRSWSNKSESLSWFQAKGMLEELFETLKVEVVWKKHEDDLCKQYDIKNSSMFHTHRIAIVGNRKDQKQIGLLGQIHSRHNSSFSINHNVYVFEINLLYLIEAINKKSSQHLQYVFQPYSNYPSITRDISCKIGQHENAKSIKEKILKTKNSLIESVEILSEYKDINYNEAEYTRNLTLRIQYRAYNRTLNDNDIRCIDNEIEQILEKSKT